MTRPNTRRFAGIAPAICIGTALLLVLLVGVWGAYRDLAAGRHSVIQAEVSRTRSHAERSVSRIEIQLLEEGYGTDLAEASKSKWLRNHWQRTISPNPGQLYGAIVNLQGVVLSHSDAQHEGKILSLGPDVALLDEFGPGVYETNSPELGHGHRVIDISVPISFQNQRVGSFHTGIDGRWLDQRVAAAQQSAAKGWTGVIGAILGVVFLSSLSLYRITRQTSRLEAALELSDARRITEVNQLIIGMAHEVRNPLNAVRLNLYTAEQVFQGDVQLDRGEVHVMLGESVREIERVDELIQQLLGYARVEPPHTELFELSSEVQSALQFLKHSLDQAHITIQIEGPDEPLLVRMDRSRLRQILLNLVKNACEAVDSEGRLTIVFRRNGEQAEMVLHDSGPGVPVTLRERIFDPFFTTKDTGTGLGLAVVRSLVEAAGGTIRCESMGDAGSCFRLSLPLATPVTGQEAA